jgi:hypothetical protein
MANAVLTGRLVERQADLARDAVDNLERLGPTFIKLGQIMSIRCVCSVDLMPLGQNGVQQGLGIDGKQQRWQGPTFIKLSQIMSIRCVCCNVEPILLAGTGCSKGLGIVASSKGGKALPLSSWARS